MPKKILPRMARAFLLILCLAAGGILFILRLLSTAPGEEFILREAQKRLEKAYGQIIRAERIETDLFSRLTIHHLSVSQPGPADTIELGYAGELDIRFSLFFLYRGEIHVNRIVLRQARLRTLRDNGAVSFPFLRAQRRETSSIPLKWKIHDVEMVDSRFTFRSSDWSADLLGLNAKGKLLQEKFAFKIDADSARLRIRQEIFPIGHLETEGVWKESIVEFDQSRIGFLGDTIDGFVRLNYGSEPESIRASFKGRMKLAPVSDRFLPGLPSEFRPVGGQADIDVQVSGNLARPEIQFAANSMKARAGEWRLQKGTVRGQWNWDSLSVDSFTVEMLLGSISGKASLSAFGEKPYRFSTRFENIDPQFGLRRYGVARVSGLRRISGQAFGRGVLSQTKKSFLSVSIRTSGKTGKGENGGKSPIPGLKFSATYRGRQLRLSFSRPGLKGTAIIILKQGGISGTYTAQVSKLADLSRIIPVPGITGRVRSQGQITGTLKAPQIKGRIHSDSILFQGLPFSRVEGRYLYSRKTGVRIENLEITGETDSLRRIELLRGHRVEGRAWYHAQISGSPGRWIGSGEIRVSDAAYGAFRFAEGQGRFSWADTSAAAVIDLLSVPLRIRAEISGQYPFRKGVARLEMLRVRDGNRIESGAAEGDPSGRASISFHFGKTVMTNGWMADIDLSLLRAMFPRMDHFEGRFNAAFDFTNPWTDPIGRADFQVVSPVYRAIRADSLIGELRAGDRALVFAARLRGGPHTASVETGIGLEKERIKITGNSRFFGYANGKNFPISLLKHLLPGSMAVEGWLSYGLRWNGTVKDPNWQGEIEITQGQWRLDPRTPPVSDIGLQLSIHDSLLTIHDLQAAMARQRIKLQGNVVLWKWPVGRANLTGSIAPSGSLRLQGFFDPESIQIWSRIRGVQLAAFRPFFPSLQDLSGLIDSELRIVGPTKHPWAEGIVLLDNFQTSVKPFSEKLEKGSARIRFLGRRMEIERSRFLWGGGSVILTGTGEYGPGGRPKINLLGRARGVRITIPDTLILGLDTARLVLHNMGPNFTLEGSIRLANSRILLDFRPESILPITEKVQAVEPSAERWPSRVSLDLRVQGSESLWVENNVAKTRMQPELEIRGTMAEPQVTGRISALEGSLFFLDREFSLQRGAADFTDPRRLNPILDILAEATIPIFNTAGVDTFHVTLSISGPLDRATIELASQPPLSRPDIFALLTLGTTTALDSDSLTASDLLLGRAAEIAGQRLAGYVGSRLGLERLTVQGNLLASGFSNLRLIAAKRFGSRFEVIYAADIGEFGRGEVRVAYRLTNHFSLEGDTDQEGRAGVDLKYGIQFK